MLAGLFGAHTHTRCAQPRVGAPTASAANVLLPSLHICSPGHPTMFAVCQRAQLAGVPVLSAAVAALVWPKAVLLLAVCRQNRLYIIRTRTSTRTPSAAANAGCKWMFAGMFCGSFVQEKQRLVSRLNGGVGHTVHTHRWPLVVILHCGVSVDSTFIEYTVLWCCQDRVPACPVL